MNTRKIRNEKILPDVTKITKVENGKKVTLSPEEQYEEICKAFNEFFKQHLNYGGEFDFFYGLRDDFFTEEMFNRILTYGETFFSDYVKKIETGQKKIITTKEKDIQRINKFLTILKKEVAKKKKAVIKTARRDRKLNPTFVPRIVAVNDKYSNYTNDEGLVVTVSAD